MIRISYILPVYGVEKYISECLDSIFSQDLPESDYEVICVDDCSPDRSNEIIRQYQQKHSNLVLIEHTFNKCRGGACNTGIKAATGEYIWFVDPDDIIATDAASKIVCYCNNKDLDALCFNYTVFGECKETLDKCFSERIPLTNGISFVEKQFGNNLIYHLGYSWRTVYRRNMILEHGICFAENMRFGQDTTFMMQAIAVADKVAAIPDALYRYRQTDSQVTSQLNGGSGRLIYYSTIGAAEMIVNWRNSIVDSAKSVAHYLDKGLPWFINRLFIRLVRTSHKQRKEFYNMLHDARPSRQLVNYMNRVNRFVVKNPIAGSVFLDVLSFFYEIKHGFLFHRNTGL